MSLENWTEDKTALWDAYKAKVINSQLPTGPRLLCLSWKFFALLSDDDEYTLEEALLHTGASERSIRKYLKICSEQGFDIQLAVPIAVDDPWQVLRAKVFATKGSQCFYCGKDASQVDHVFPKSRGGADEMDNLVPACARCNLSKGSKTPEEWRGGSVQ